MSSDPAEPQPGDLPAERTGEIKALKARSDAPAPSVESVVASAKPAPESSHPTEAKPESKSNLSLTPVGSSSSAGPGPGSPVTPQFSAGKPAPNDSQVAGLKPTILQLPSGMLPIDIKRDYLRDFGTLLVAIAAVVIAVLAYQVNKKQAESLAVQSQAAQEQSRAAQEEVNVKFIEEFKQHLGELTIPEEEQNQENLTKKTLAAITLAQYRERALPALKMSLSVEDEDIKDGAAVVVVQMLLQGELRATVFTSLQKYFDESNPSLRVGILDCYVTMDRELTDEEFNEVTAKINQHVQPNANYLDKPREQRLLLEAVKFFANWPRRASIDFLFAVVRNRTCGDEVLEGAINSLPWVITSATDLSDEEREASKQQVLAELQQLQSVVSARLKKNVTGAIASLKKK